MAANETKSLTPEARRHRLEHARGRIGDQLDRVKPGTRPFEVARRVFNGTFEEGFMHAGNLAFLSLLTIFPSVILLASVAGFFGRTADGQHAIAIFLDTVPRGVSELLEKPIYDVITSRAGPLLWLAGLFALWSVSGFVETIREILRRAYGTTHSHPFYTYRLYSAGIILGSVALALVAFALQIVLTGAQSVLETLFPGWDVNQLVALGRLVPVAALFAAMYIMFYTLTPARYRARRYPKWPGALLTTLWWMSTTALTPLIFYQLSNYDLTYGSLASVMIALMFFFIIGLGVVVGAQLNAALAELPKSAVEREEDAARDAEEKKLAEAGDSA